MEGKKLIEALHPLERKVLPVLEKNHLLSDISKAAGLKEIEAMRALQWLENRGLAKTSQELKEVAAIDSNGEIYAKEGLPEKRFIKAISEKPLSLNEIPEKAGLTKEEMNICLGMLKSKAAIIMEKGMVGMSDQGKKFMQQESLEEKFLKRLEKGHTEIKSLKDEEKFAYELFRKRKGIVKTILLKIRSAELTAAGKKLSKMDISAEKTIDRLTPAMLRTGAWKGKAFRRYDVRINVPSISGGKRHFVSQAIEYIKKIWLEMGFREMNGSLTQTAFWDLDSLFVPQDHPARQMQDTFYLKDPAKGKLPANLWQKVKSVHENGADTGSKGWQSKWSEEIAKENLLRTHTTVLSAQAISKLRKEDLPAKFFSIAKVFRNEALDWKHLFEFHQVEGIVVDPNANMRHLKGYLKDFFSKMGYDEIRIRPAHFPYTEPSAEVEVFNTNKGEWVELGGCGIFRPEMVKPLLGIDCPVLAWGMGMERVISEYFRITDIRQLYGNDLKQTRNMKMWMR